MQNLTEVAKAIDRMPHSVYCEPFANCFTPIFEKKPSKVEVINDLDTQFIDFYRAYTLNPQDFFATKASKPALYKNPNSFTKN